MTPSSATTEHIEILLTEILKQGGFPEARVTHKFSELFPHGVILQVSLEEKRLSRLLIGPRGEHLRALQYLLHRIVRERFQEETPSFLIDINSYLEGRMRRLRAQAERAAREALRDDRPIFFPPLSALERRIIHTTLASYEGVETESIGEKGERRVVVRPSRDL